MALPSAFRERLEQMEQTCSNSISCTSPNPTPIPNSVSIQLFKITSDCRFHGLRTKITYARSGLQWRSHRSLHHLLFIQKGASVTLVEKSSIACAVSGKARGFLALDLCDSGTDSSLAQPSFNLHRTLAEELNGPEVYGYRPVTTLSFSITKSEFSIGTTETTAQVHPQLFTKTLVKKTAEELYSMFRGLGDSRCTLEDCWRMINGVDKNGDGFLCFGDFCHIMDLHI